MSLHELDENEKNFLLQIYNSTKGDTTVQVSMYDISAALNLDRDASSKLAEELIGGASQLSQLGDNKKSASEEDQKQGKIGAKQFSANRIWQIPGHKTFTIQAFQQVILTLLGQTHPKDQTKKVHRALLE